jgi:hypothetical protein
LRLFRDERARLVAVVAVNNFGTWTLGGAINLAATSSRG